MDQAEKASPRIVSEEEIYRGRIVSLKKVQVQMPDGPTLEREVVVHAGSVGILPISEDGRFVFVRQFRLPARASLLELPAGSLEARENPTECAQRELAEEIGQRADTMREIARFYLAPGWATELMHGFVATGLSPHKLQGDDDEDIELELLTPKEALEGIRSGEIQDCKSIALIGLYLAEQYNASAANRAPSVPAGPGQP